MGLVLCTIEYALLSNEHYVVTVHPVFLITPQGTTQHESICLNKENEEDIRLLRETLDVENYPIKQIVAVLGKDHLKELCNIGTEIIIVSIPQVLVNVFAAHCMLDLGVLYRE